MTRMLAIAALAVALLAAAPTSAPAQSRDLSSYAILAGTELRASGVSVSAGDIGVNAGALIASRPIAATASKIVASSLRLASGSQCSALYGEPIFPTGPACGPPHAFTSPIFADLAAACGVPATFPACGGLPVTVGPGETRVLTPGMYGDVIVSGGGGSPGTLTFAGGEYHICSLRASRHAQIFARTASTVFVTGALNLSNGTFTGPTASGVSPCDLQLLVGGSRLHVSRHAQLKARLCAPHAALYVGSGAALQGGFAANTMRLGRVTVAGAGCRAGGTTTTTISSSTTTTHASSTTTTLPAVCGNNHREGDEECDGQDLGGATCNSLGLGTGQLKCLSNCRFDRLGCTCGNGVVDPVTGEECDPAAATSACNEARECGAADTTDRCMCIVAREPAVEICGNCIDDDGNGLTDFEDPACCPSGRAFSLTLRRGRIKSKGATVSKLRLRAILAQSGLDGVNPQKEDVFLQIRPAGGTDIFCARIPASKWAKKRRTFKFRDRKHTVASAHGLDVMKIKVKPGKGVRLRTRARQAQLKTPSQGNLQVTVGFHSDATGNAQNRCTSAVARFRTGHKGRLKAP